MLPLGGNYKHDNWILKSNWEYIVCRASDDEEGVLETQEHISIYCPGLKDIRTKFDLHTNLGLLDFYWAVMIRRKDIEERE